ncbi:secreted RxLR effector protein 161-like [Humulus lupulus]|uniref:secreted RxLR effector protein 161-like n=1 Tax=Humulus lupulus TaxID=3486 RepID=UPI002B401D2F|nr:secreted RxLR effector protein 161-like [Humulus lupulus]
MGATRRILGIDIHRDRKKHQLRLAQSQYLKSVIKKFNMIETKDVVVLLGGEDHWKGLKWLLRYLKATTQYGLVFRKTRMKAQLEGYVDADYASNKDTRKSLTSYCFLLNSCCISWKSQLQPIVVLSTTEAEFIATTEAFKEAIWLK